LRARLLEHPQVGVPGEHGVREAFEDVAVGRGDQFEAVRPVVWVVHVIGPTKRNAPGKCSLGTLYPARRGTVVATPCLAEYGRVRTRERRVGDLAVSSCGSGLYAANGYSVPRWPSR
jgi:hypothetical protein